MSSNGGQLVCRIRFGRSALVGHFLPVGKLVDWPADWCIVAFGEVAIVGRWVLRCYLDVWCQLIVGWLIGRPLVGPLFVMLLSGDLWSWGRAILVSSWLSWSSVPSVG